MPKPSPKNSERLTRKEIIDQRLTDAGWRIVPEAKFDASKPLATYNRCAVEEYQRVAVRRRRLPNVRRREPPYGSELRGFAERQAMDIVRQTDHVHSSANPPGPSRATDRHYQSNSASVTHACRKDTHRRVVNRIAAAHEKIPATEGS